MSLELTESTEVGMGNEEKILTKHPLGKTGRNISKQRYDVLKQAIEGVLRIKDLTHTE